MPAAFTHAPIALLPTPFPRDVFDLALRVSPLFAALSDTVSRDHEFLRDTLAGVILTDDFTARIWRIYEVGRLVAPRLLRVEGIPNELGGTM
jgi:glutathione synthase